MTVTKDQVFLSLYQSICLLADTVGIKEAETPGHQHNTALIAESIGKIMNLDQDVIDGIRIGATLHDFGIIRVPLSILKKPGRLTPQEYEIVKQHPVYGFQVVKAIEFPWPVGRIILQHHERMDGSGYPGGIKGEDIDLESRIVGVADVMNSMTTDRPWRGSLPVDTALDELKKNRGTKYDPAVVDACVDLYTNHPHLLTKERLKHG